LIINDKTDYMLTEADIRKIVSEELKKRPAKQKAMSPRQRARQAIRLAWRKKYPFTY